MSTKWFVYMLDCDGTHLYTGISNDVVKRLNDHRSGKAAGAKFTRRFKNIKLAYSVKCTNKRQAQRIEYALKRKNRQVKLGIVSERPDLDQLKALILNESAE